MLIFDIEKALVFIEKIAMDSMKSMAVLCIKCHRVGYRAALYMSIFGC